MVGESIRKLGFWTLDAIRGGKIYAHQKHLQQVKYSGKGDQKALTDLLVHASKTVPAYKGMPAELKFFPVVSKQDYRKNFEAYRSSLHLDESKLHKVFTSGSSGTPFMAYQDTNKLKWHQAGLIEINNDIGWGLGDRFAFLRVWGVAHNTRNLSLMLSNTVPVNVINFDRGRQEAFRQRMLHDKSLHLILGYASALEKLAEYLIECNDGPKTYGITLVIADSENLSAKAKQTIEKAFACPVLNRYANNENGILALTKENDDRFFVNYPEYYVEILKLNSDEPVVEGEAGRIVITDLYNYAFPFVRYDTGDIGVAEKVVDGQCFVISQLLGRVSASLTKTDGVFITESSVTAYFENMINIGRYQIIQEAAKDYRIKIESTHQKLNGNLIERAKACFGNDANITIEHVVQIQQGKNGKYPITVNEIKK